GISAALPEPELAPLSEIRATDERASPCFLSSPAILIAQQLPTQILHRPPLILDFEAIEDAPQVWTFRGRVNGEDAPGEVVQFGGLDSLQGRTAIVAQDGRFQLTVQLQRGERGTATAQTQDRRG